MRPLAAVCPLAPVRALRGLTRLVLTLGGRTRADGPLAALPLRPPLTLGLSPTPGVLPLSARRRRRRRRQRGLVLLLVAGVPRAR